MRTLLENIRQRLKERRERRDERLRGTENIIARLEALLGMKGER